MWGLVLFIKAAFNTLTLCLRGGEWGRILGKVFCMRGVFLIFFLILTLTKTLFNTDG